MIWLTLLLCLRMHRKNDEEQAKVAIIWTFLTLSSTSTTLIYALGSDIDHIFDSVIMHENRIV